jgi:hypothetical protein
LLQWTVGRMWTKIACRQSLPEAVSSNMPSKSIHHQVEPAKRQN